MQDGRYTSMSNWSQTPEGNLLGTMELPMAVGIVGGAPKYTLPLRLTWPSSVLKPLRNSQESSSALVLRKTSVHFGRSQRKASKLAT